jgi:hypothetical protein
LPWSKGAALLALSLANACAQDRVLTQLTYGGGCSSTVELRNLSAVAVDAVLEAHRGNGALLGFAGIAGNAVRLAPGATARYRLDIPENETDTHAWVVLRDDGGRTSVALSGATECRDGNELRTLPREVAYPMRNAIFAGDVPEIRGSLLAVINTSPQTAVASVCYSSGNLYSVPGDTPAARDLQPICSTWRDVQVPPYGTRNLEVQRGGSTWFSVKVRGDAVLLEILRPADSSMRTYRVDSTIRFGSEVPPTKR